MPYEYVKHTRQLQLKSFFQRTLWVHGNKEGIYSVDHHGGEFRCTWREEYKRLCRLGNALRGLGVEVGDKVGCFVWNTHRSGELSFAVPMTGSVFHPINIRYSREHFLYTINKSKDKVMFVDEDLIQLVEGLKDDLKTVKSYIIMTPSKRLPQTKLSPVYSYDELLEQSSDVYDFPDNIPENSLAVLSYTSGTTGLPKGIGWSPRSIILGCLGQCGVDQDEYSEEDVVLIPINLFHANGQNCGWATMMFGGRIIWPGPHPSSAGLLDLIEKEKVTYFRGATTIQAFVMQEWEKGKYDLRSLKKIRSGASAPNKALIEWLDSKGIRFAWAYGMAETPGNLAKVVSSEQRKHWPKEKYIEKMTRQGYPIPGVEIRVINMETGKDVAWDGAEIGEVIARGPWVIEEYYDSPETTEEMFKDGWFHIGDLAVVEEDGSIRLVDRIKDIIKSGGEWISSVDLENIIMENPVVRQAVVFGVPDPKWDERPAAAIILKDEHKGKVTKEDILHPMSSRVPSWWKPDHVLFVDELPMTGGIKVLKRVLRDMWKEGKFGNQG